MNSLDIVRKVLDPDTAERFHICGDTTDVSVFSKEGEKGVTHLALLTFATALNSFSASQRLPESQVDLPLFMETLDREFENQVEVACRRTPSIREQFRTETKDIFHKINRAAAQASPTTS